MTYDMSLYHANSRFIHREEFICNAKTKTIRVYASDSFTSGSNFHGKVKCEGIVERIATSVCPAGNE